MYLKSQLLLSAFYFACRLGTSSVEGFQPLHSSSSSSSTASRRVSPVASRIPSNSALLVSPTIDGWDLYEEDRTAASTCSTAGGMLNAQLSRISSALLPSALFLATGSGLGSLFSDMVASPSLPKDDFGVLALLLVTAATAYDNYVLGLGRPLFSGAATNKNIYSWLKKLSLPRFTAHAVGIPYLFSTVAEIGRGAGVEWLQAEWVQPAMLVLETAVAVASCVHLHNSPDIVLADTSASPPGAWEHEVVWFTYKEKSAVHVVPAIMLTLFALAVGVAAVATGDKPEAGMWLAASGAAVLCGNAQPSHVARFSGNVAELAMLWCMSQAGSVALM